MARICVGQFHFQSFSVLVILFGLTLSSQFQIKEITELVEDFDDSTEKYVLEKHDIVRRAAPNDSVVSPSTSITFPSKHVLPRISSSSLQQPVSPTILRLSSISKTVLPASKTMSFVTGRIPTTLPPVTSKTRPNTTPKHTDATSKGTTTDHQETSPSSSRPSEYFKDHHKYYTSHYYSHGKQWWFNLDDGSKEPTFHDELSKNIKFSDLLQTSFIFPYYGHRVNNVTVTNKGYVFLGERLHRFNASAQYAAPLMADFVVGADTSIRYVDTGDRLTVEWANMRVRNESPDLKFSFQCTIFKNGTLIFSYKKVPKEVNKLKKNNLHVRVGLSDTFIREKIVYGPHTVDGKTYSAVRFIIYYLYDRVKLPKDRVVSESAFIIIPVPNCVMFNSCDTCTKTQTKFDCQWCSQIQRCSDGIDRHRMQWETAGCLLNSTKSCSIESSNSLDGGVIAVIVILLLLIILAFAWFVYAYSHPQTKSGLFLIRYGNPTKWCRNSSGEGTRSSTDGRISFKTMSFESNA